MDLNELSTGALLTLDAMLVASSYNGHDFGFMDEAHDLLTDVTKHQFAGYVSHLTKVGAIEWSEDLSADKGVHIDGVQFALAEWVQDAEQKIADMAQAITDATPADEEPAEQPRTTIWTKTIKCADGDIVITQWNDGVWVEQNGALKVTEATLTAAHKMAADKTTGFKGNQLALVRKFITLRIREQG